MQPIVEWTIVIHVAGTHHGVIFDVKHAFCLVAYPQLIALFCLCQTTATRHFLMSEETTAVLAEAEGARLELNTIAILYTIWIVVDRLHAMPILLQCFAYRCDCRSPRCAAQHGPSRRTTKE